MISQRWAAVLYGSAADVSTFVKCVMMSAKWQTQSPAPRAGAWIKVMWALLWQSLQSGRVVGTRPALYQAQSFDKRGEMLLQCSRQVTGGMREGFTEEVTSELVAIWCVAPAQWKGLRHQTGSSAARSKGRGKSNEDVIWESVWCQAQALVDSETRGEWVNLSEPQACHQ